MADLNIFLPDTIIDLLSVRKGQDPFSLEEGTILFCDVAGFTPLTEALSGMGKEGSEELTRILNRYFTEMIEITDRFGGDVVRFGGDAMTIYFPKGHENNALTASHAMMKKMEAFKQIMAGNLNFSLEMKIGAAYGRTVFGVLGDAETGRDYYAAGQPLDESAEAEHKAAKGKIILHPSFPRICGTDVIPMENGFGESRFSFPVPEESTARRERAEVPPESAGLVPRHLVERAGEGTLGEHRGTTVIFLGFEGLAPGDDQKSSGSFHRDLDIFFHHIASAARNYGGIINKLDMGDKGMKAIFLFGSPYALENKEEMAVRCALEIRDKNPLAARISLKMGVTSSALFNGPVGSPTRREFTVMGDGINTAARLMQKAGVNQIFCDEKTMEATKGAVDWSALDPLVLKGKENPVPVFVPAGFARKEEISDLPSILERDDELGRIKDLLLKGSSPVLIAGEAGLGKTVLIEWARKESAALNMTATRIFLAPYHRTRAYSLWRGALRSLIGANKEDADSHVKELRDAMLDKDSRGYGPLLNPLLGLEKEESESIGQLSPRERKELTFAVTEKLIMKGGERLILADNLEWADPLSLELLNFLLQGGGDLPMKFMASCRSVSADLERIAVNFDCLPIRPFSKEGTDAHLRLNLKLDAVSANLLGWFLSKTGGNPKLIAAIFQILKEKGILSLENGKYTADEDRLFSTPFPERLEDIYLGKIDELPRDEREIVQVASVLGYSVSLYLLSLASEMKKDDARKIAEKLIEKGIFRSDSWGERPYLRFSDSLLKDAVYNALPFSLKRETHLKCALFLEKDGGEKSGLFPIIAGHFAGAGDKSRANVYNKKSAFDALNRFDNLTAMRFLEEILEGPVTQENMDCCFSLVEVYGNLGRAREEVDLISRIEGIEKTLKGRDRLRFLSFETKKSIMQRDFAKSEELFILSEKIAREIGDIPALAKIYVNMAGGFYGPSGELQKARETLEKCLALPDSKESSIFKVTALFNNGNIMKHEGRNDEALGAFKKAYRKAGSLKLLPQMANIAQSIASLLYSQGRYRDALEWAKRARKWAETFGLRQLLLMNTHLMGVLEHSLGLSAGARRSLEANVDKAKRFSNPYVEAISQEALIDVGFSLLDLNCSLERGSAALETARNIKAPLTFKYTLVEMLRLFESISARDEARKFIEEGRYGDCLRDSPPSPSIEPLLEAYMGWAEGSAPGYSRGELESLSPDLKLDYLFFYLREAVDKNNGGMISERLGEACSHMAGSPSVSFKVKLYYYFLRTGIDCPGEIRKESLRILKKYPSGVYGIRALSLVWGSERIGSVKDETRRAVINALYRFKGGSPGWAFDHLVSFREIREILRGTV